MRITVVVDMNKGFCEKGELADPKIKNIVPKINELLNIGHTLSQRYDKYDYLSVALMDYHKEEDYEFDNYPKHCLIDTNEVEMIDEINSIYIDSIIKKNTTNGTFNFLDFLFDTEYSSEPLEIVICGCCTDICIEQLAIGMQTFFYYKDWEDQVIVIEDAVATYDSEVHNAKLCHESALNRMRMAGVQVMTLDDFKKNLHL